MKEKNTTQTAENGFKETEIGLIPIDWDIDKLGKYCEVFSGNAFKSSDFAEKGVLIVKIGNLQDGTIVVDNRTNYYPKTIDESLKKFVLKKEDVLIALTGATTGKVAVVPEKFEGSLLNQRVGKFNIFDKKLDNSFFRFFSITSRFQDDIKGNILKSAQGNVSPKKIEQLMIIFPTFSEQQKIAFVLSKIQQVIEQQNKIIQTTKELKKSLMNKLFTEGLHDEEQKETEIGLIPKNWDVIKLGDVFEIQQGKQLSSKFQKGISPYPFLRTANVLWGRIDISTVDLMDFTPEEVAKLTLKQEDLLVCEGGDIGRTAIWDGQLSPCLYQNHLHRLRPLQKDIFPRFYMYWMQVAHLYLGIYAGTGNITTIPNLSQSRLRLFLLPKPSFDEQKEIANILSSIDKKLTQSEARKQTLQALFKTMLNQLMIGKIRVKDLDIEAS